MLCSREPPPTEKTRMASRVVQPRARQPVAVGGVPALVVDPRRQLRDVVARGVALDVADLAEVVDRVRRVARAAAGAEDEEPPAARAHPGEGLGDRVDGVGVEGVRDLGDLLAGTRRRRPTVGTAGWAWGGTYTTVLAAGGREVLLRPRPVRQRRIARAAIVPTAETTPIKERILPASIGGGLMRLDAHAFACAVDEALRAPPKLISARRRAPWLRRSHGSRPSGRGWWCDMFPARCAGGPGGHAAPPRAGRQAETRVPRRGRDGSWRKSKGAYQLDGM